MIPCLWCKTPFPPGTGRTKGKEFCQRQCQLAFLRAAQKMGRETLRRRLERKRKGSGIKKNATPAERLGALAAIAREVLR